MKLFTVMTIIMLVAIVYLIASIAVEWQKDAQQYKVQPQEQFNE